MNETYKAEIKRLLNAIHDEDSLCKIYTLALVRANHEASQEPPCGGSFLCLGHSSSLRSATGHDHLPAAGCANYAYPKVEA
ncbi:hypothetical protein AALA00_02260 [Lachnospiraceae bacterium 46-15]